MFSCSYIGRNRKPNDNMNRKLLIAFADKIRCHNSFYACGGIEGIRNRFTEKQIETLADFCVETNPSFKRERWLNYIAGKCGPNGGEIK